MQGEAERVVKLALAPKIFAPEASLRSGIRHSPRSIALFVNETRRGRFVSNALHAAHPRRREPTPRARILFGREGGDVLDPWPGALIWVMRPEPTSGAAASSPPAGSDRGRRAPHGVGEIRALIGLPQKRRSTRHGAAEFSFSA